jgi:hypothetical protein
MKYGRKPKYLDQLPHLSALIQASSTLPLPAPPASVEWTTGMPHDLGMMMNDSLGDCVEAAWGHAQQVWTFNSNPPMVTLSDLTIEQFYEVAGGYILGNSNTDNGTDIQTALLYLINTGLAGNKLRAAAFINPNHTDNIKLAIATTGLVYIGFNVPAYLQMLEQPGATWDIYPNENGNIIGGHCVILTGYADGVYTLISWGSTYKMTEGFFNKFVDEAYALVDKNWINSKGLDPNQEPLSALVQLVTEIGKPTGGSHGNHNHRWKRKRYRKLSRLVTG